jgi:hypothetical protein
VVRRSRHRRPTTLTVAVHEVCDGAMSVLARSLHRGIAARLVDRERLAVVIARVARLAELPPQIAEMDLNPVVCTPGACRLVDARIRVALVAAGRGA